MENIKLLGIINIKKRRAINCKRFNDYLIKDAGKITYEIACDKALIEFEKYRIKQN